MAKLMKPEVSFIALFTCWTISAQPPESGPLVSIIPRSASQVAANPAGAPEGHLRIDSLLALIPVHATASMGGNVTGLVRANFRVFEDGVEQRITTFSKEDAPLSVGLVFDSSGSMTNKVRKSAEAAAAFFKTANADDEFFLVQFGERPKLLTPFTSDSGEIYRKIATCKPFGRTSLIDAIHLALVQMKRAKNSRKAIVILSDGGDNRSRLTRGEIKSALLESEVQLYAMGIFDPDDLAKHTREEQNGPRLLDDLAEATGGRLYPVENLDDLESISETLGNTLRTEYLLGYSPLNQSRDGKYRRVNVDLIPPANLSAPNITYRHGYYAPVE